MSALDEVYGKNYQNDSIQSRCEYILNLIVNHIVHRQFVVNLDNGDILWNNDHLSQQTIDQLCQKVQQQSQQLEDPLIIRHINLQNIEQKKYLPYLILSTPVEYFYIIDKKLQKYYFIFITPSQMGSY